MAVKLAIWLIFSIGSAILYWLGGRNWANKAFRRFGCPLVIYGYLWLISPYKNLKWAIFAPIAYILTALALSTYHDYLAPDGSSENWLCWLVTGFVYGLAAFPFIWCGVSMVAIVIRTIVLGLLTMGWSLIWQDVNTEESGRGAILAATVPLLLL